MQFCQIDKLQNNALAQMGFDSSLQEVETEVSELVFALLATHPNTGEIALGKIGKQLIELVNKLDLHHADAISLIDNIFDHDERFRQQVLEVIELADKCKHLSTISKNFCKLIDRNKFAKPFFRTEFNIRLLKSLQERQLARNERKSQIVNLKAFYKKGNKIWEEQPSDFEIFNRHNVPYVEHLELAEKRVSRYSELGCDSITSKISEEIKQFKIVLRDRYYGFNRMTMTTASVILAKMHGYKLRTSWDVYDKKSLNIIVPTTLLYDFEPIELPIFVKDFSLDEYQYEPRLYPLHQLIHTASEEMLRVIDHLDFFPEINGKALFDNFLILVPSVKLPQKDGTYFVKDRSGNTLGFDRQDEAVKFLDMTLIDSHSVQPVLFGERNGNCYFLCYWL